MHPVRDIIETLDRILAAESAPQVREVLDSARQRGVWAADSVLHVDGLLQAGGLHVAKLELASALLGALRERRLIERLEESLAQSQAEVSMLTAGHGEGQTRPDAWLMARSRELAPLFGVTDEEDLKAIAHWIAEGVRNQRLRVQEAAEHVRTFLEVMPDDEWQELLRTPLSRRRGKTDRTCRNEPIAVWERKASRWNRWFEGWGEASGREGPKHRTG
jgi:hypothetical protein